MANKNLFSSYKGLPKSVFVLFAARIINCIGSFVYPFLTMFLTIKLGYSTEKAGFFVTAVFIAGSIGLLSGGKLADRFGRKKIFILLSTTSALFFIVCAFMDKSPAIPWLLIISNVFLSGILPCINAMITDLTKPEKRNAAFSLIYLGQNLGVAIGPLIAGFLFNDHMKLIFILDAVTTLLSLIPVLVLVKETIPVRGKSIELNDNEKIERGNVIFILFRKPILVSFAFISLIYTFVYSQNFFSLPLYLKLHFSERGPKVYGTLMSVNAIVVILLTVFLIGLMKNTKPIINIAFAGILYAIGFGVIYLITNEILLILSTVVWTLGEIIQTINTNVYVANNSPITHRARFSGIISFITDIGYIASPIIMGYFIKHYGVHKVWPLVIVLAVAASVFMYILYLVESNKKLNRNNQVRQQ
ncbi:MAG: MFS transporter [Actinomycetota bacterium]|nr:MFS transporter [Actinomycetota bacterium]